MINYHKKKKKKKLPGASDRCIWTCSAGICDHWDEKSRLIRLSLFSTAAIKKVEGIKSKGITDKRAPNQHEDTQEPKISQSKQSIVDSGSQSQ